jgi:hypothetical protein
LSDVIDKTQIKSEENINILNNEIDNLNNEEKKEEDNKETLNNEEKNEINDQEILNI